MCRAQGCLYVCSRDTVRRENGLKAAAQHVIPEWTKDISGTQPKQEFNFLGPGSSPGMTRMNNPVIACEVRRKNRRVSLRARARNAPERTARSDRFEYDLFWRIRPRSRLSSALPH